jgi:predicted metal-binding membrane protein
VKASSVPARLFKSVTGPVYGIPAAAINAAYWLGMAGKDEDFGNLDAAGRALAALAGRPRRAVYTALAAAIGLSWLLLALMAARSAMLSGPGPAGPGAGLAESLSELPWPAFFDRFFRLCLTSAPLEAGYAGQLAALTLMWFLMAIAMMLPSAVPMIRTYCEIADTASAKGEKAAHPMVLAAGYLTVWLGASLCFAGLTFVIRAGTSEAVVEPLGGAASAIALVVAGLYQFSGLKEACLKKCRNPFNILFSRWSQRPSRILALGLEQGFWCLGCCWALMLVMFAVGIMNLSWMALIALFTVVEKQVPGRLPSLAAGAILLVWGAALLLIAV